MADEGRIEELQSALQRRFRMAGRGSVHRVQESLNLGAGYFKNQRRSGRRRIDLKIFLRALEVMEIEASEFFASVFGPADPVDRFRTRAARAVRRAKSTPTILAHESRRKPGQGREGQADFETLDVLRFDDPVALVRRTKSLIREVADSEVPILLGIHASACRILGKQTEALMVLGRALDLVEEHQDSRLFADLVVRAGYVAAQEGDLNLAFDLAERTTLVFVRLGDVLGIGKSLVDQASLLAGLNRTEEQLRTLKSALKVLPADSEDLDVRKYRLACLQNLGYTYHKLDRLEDARRFTAAAHECSEGLGREGFGKLVWLEGTIAMRSGRYSEAERFFEEAVAALRPVSPVSAAVCSLELVRVQLARGATADAYQTAKASTVLLDHLDDNSIAAAAVTDLVRCALTGRGLTAAFLDQVRRGLEGSRVHTGTRHSARSAG
jgi:tetratricopeptide (TPR) repeat protein